MKNFTNKKMWKSLPKNEDDLWEVVATMIRVAQAWNKVNGSAQHSTILCSAIVFGAAEGGRAGMVLMMASWSCVVVFFVKLLLKHSDAVVEQEILVREGKGWNMPNNKNWP